MLNGLQKMAISSGLGEIAYYLAMAALVDREAVAEAATEAEAKES
jgi:hypothetical protein